MRTLLPALFVLLASAQVQAQDSGVDRDRVLVIQLAEDLLAAITAKDSTAFMSLMAPGARAYAITGQGLRFRDATVDAAGLVRAKTQPDFLERMWDPEVIVAGDVAVVYTPYDFWLGRRLSHCGTDIFTMVRTDEGWRMASVVYDVVTEGCESPLGPPKF